MEPIAEPDEPEAVVAHARRRRRKGSISRPRDGFQPSGTSWDPQRPDAAELLLGAEEIEMRSIYYGSNACFLVVLSDPVAGRSLAVYKPARGEYPLWDFPQGSLYRREVATFRLAQLIGWNLVPPTVVSSGRFGVGSLQLFLEASQEQAVQARSLRRLILLDWITNNADRKPAHVIVGSGGTLWGIDHGLTFHVEPKLRTAFWHFAGELLDEEEGASLSRLQLLLSTSESDGVHELLTAAESRALLVRVQALVSGGIFPDPLHKTIPYRW